MASAERGSAGTGTSAAAAAAADDDIGAFVAGFDAGGKYRTRRLIKENPWERTELVEDADGKRYVRKYLKLDSEAAGPHPYERIAGLRSPYLPHVVSTLRMGDVLVVICDWVEGKDLQALFEQYGPPTHDELVQVFDDVCEAAQALHDAPGGAIVHRDINPANVVFDGKHAHLIDLGIARGYHEGASADTHLWGTAGYAAPEQFGFGQSDGRADVYALGMLLRFLLTGKHPDEAVGAGELTERQQRVIERATQVDPKDRFRDVAGLRRAGDLALRPPTGPIAWRPHAHPVLWYLWCAVAWTFVAFMVYGSVGTIVTGMRPASYAPAYFFLDFFFAFVPVVLLTGSFGVTERIAWFRDQRLPKVVAVSLVSAFVGLLGCGVAAGWWS